MKRRYDRRQLLLAGFGLCALPWPAPVAAASRQAVARSTLERAVADLPAAGDWARRALAALEGPGRRFVRHADGAACDLGACGHLELAPVGEGAGRVTLTGGPGELDILCMLDAPRVARVEARMVEPVAPATGPGFDTLRRIPGGFELTFSSALALRHAPPRVVAGEPPAVYGRLARAALSRAGTLL